MSWHSIFFGRPSPTSGAAMSYSLSELSGAKMKEFFDAAFMEATIDSDGDVLVNTPLRVSVQAEAEKGILKCLTIFGVNADREAILEFCNRFNRDFILCRCFVTDDRDSDGDWRVIFDYDRFMPADEKTSAKTVVLLVRRFTDIVTNGIRRVDEDGLFNF